MSHGQERTRDLRGDVEFDEVRGKVSLSELRAYVARIDSRYPLTAPLPVPGAYRLIEMLWLWEHRDAADPTHSKGRASGP